MFADFPGSVNLAFDDGDLSVRRDATLPAEQRRVEPTSPRQELAAALERSISTTTLTSQVIEPRAFRSAVLAHVDERATDDQLQLLETNDTLWVATLFRLLEDGERALEDARQREKGPGRENVLTDFDGYCDRIDDVITERIGPPSYASSEPPPSPTAPSTSPPELVG